MRDRFTNAPRLQRRTTNLSIHDNIHRSQGQRQQHTVHRNEGQRRQHTVQRNEGQRRQHTVQRNEGQRQQHTVQRNEGQRQQHTTSPSRVIAIASATKLHGQSLMAKTINTNFSLTLTHCIRHPKDRTSNASEETHQFLWAFHVAQVFQASDRPLDQDLQARRG